MTIRTKIALATVFVLLALFLIPLLITRVITTQPEIPPAPETPAQPQDMSSVQIDTKPFRLAEGYLLDVPTDWIMTQHTPDRNVDRYRLERQSTEKGVFTVSFYTDAKSFEEVVADRYGDGYVTTPTTFDIPGFEAVKVTSGFFQQGDTSDVLVKLDDGSFISLYGIYQTDSSDTALIQEEIRRIQVSFKKEQPAQQ